MHLDFLSSGSSEVITFCWIPDDSRPVTVMLEETVRYLTLKSLFERKVDF